MRRLQYDEQRYPTAEECLTGIKDRIRWGWQVSEVRGQRDGYLVTFRLQVEEAIMRDSPRGTDLTGGTP